MNDSQPKASRRGFFLMASASGAVVASTTWLKTPIETPLAAAADPIPAPEKGGGYSLSDHVKQYYKTTLV